VDVILDVLREMGDTYDDGISAGHGGDKGDIR